MLEQARQEDVVIGSGGESSVRQVVELAGNEHWRYGWRKRRCELGEVSVYC
ncbi:hypothetical protein [Salmonella enterica]|uniref:hypothetical protein n=1 Tax=Salmonella enterica TaxID=28901 RepID=UPI00398C7C9A